MEIIFLPPADTELEDAIHFYENQLKGLGHQFYTEVVKAIDFIIQYPEGWHKTGQHTRRFMLKRFPYSILYVYEEEKIIITAIAHQHRHPESYLNRME